MTWGLSSVSVAFGATTALDNVSVLAEPGTVTVVVGGDGAGKSTLLRTLVGIARTRSGDVHRPAKEAMGYVPAAGGLYGDLSVEQNLAFSGKAYSMTPADIKASADQVLERIGLSEFRTRLAGQLSGGMQRKLALSMALLHRPGLLVLDEPTTGVDPVSRAELWRLIGAAAARGAAVVASTTYVDEALRASSIILLEQGRVLASGAPADIIASVPGRVGVVTAAPDASTAYWRHGATWRIWGPTGELPPQAVPVPVTFHDAVIIASLADEETRAHRRRQ